ncbi:MAG: tripartite tricarboxylate transporter substrate binding protein, partial [Roseomonas sp.]|nr:tripartite tricarboxylate transporter substrate binding protein [Roseomonas sp.]
MMQRRMALSLALAAGLAPNVARAQGAWRPSRPVRLVVPFAPGGSNDIVGRIVAEAAGNVLGQPVVVENRAGAGSVIGAENVARSPADGYSVLINSAHASVPALVSRVPYDTINDFVGIAVAGFSPHVLVANPRTPVTSAAELIALLRTNPGRFNFASAGIGSGVHLAGEIFRGISAAQFEMVHYRGGGPGVAALVSAPVRAYHSPRAAPRRPIHSAAARFAEWR